MSRYNQFTGFSGASRINGVEGSNEQEVLARVEPVINSWMARCRLLAQGSGLQVVVKHLNTPLFNATWSWQFGNETLTVNISPVAVNPQRVSPEEPDKPKQAEPIPPEKPEEPEPEIPTPAEIEKIQIENDLPPIPPQLIKTLVILYDDEYFVVYDMRSIEKGLGTQKPLIKNAKSQGNWALPDHCIVRRIRDYYFGNMVYARYAAGSGDFPVHQCLQMTNNKDMGAVSVASVSFAGGSFSRAGTFQVYRLRSGLKSINSTSLQTCIGMVGSIPFPALNANATTVWANRHEFKLNDETKNLEMSNENAWPEIASYDITTDFNLPEQIDISPNFIDSNGKAYFDSGWAEMVIMPCMGSTFLYAAYSVDNPMNYAATGTGGGLTNHMNIAKFTQVDGIDVLTQEKIDVTSSMGGAFDYDWTVNVLDYSSTWPDIPADLIGPHVGLSLVPYHESGISAYYSPRSNEHGDRYIKSVFGPEQNSDPGLSYSQAVLCFDEIYTPLMHVSNGEHVISGFNIHNPSYGSGGMSSWALGDNYFFLDGTDVTAELETICGTTRDKIQIIFMDVPLYSAQTIKLAPKT